MSRGALREGERAIPRAGGSGGGREVVHVADRGEEAGCGVDGGSFEAGLVREVDQLGGLGGDGDLRGRTRRGTLGLRSGSR